MVEIFVFLKGISLKSSILCDFRPPFNVFLSMKNKINSFSAYIGHERCMNCFVLVVVIMEHRYRVTQEMISFFIDDVISGLPLLKDLLK